MEDEDNILAKALADLKDRQLLLRVERDFIAFISKYKADQGGSRQQQQQQQQEQGGRKKTKACLQFPPLNSYHRLIQLNSL